MATGLITGADMGLGFELTKLGLLRGNTMIAIVLHASGENITGLKSQYGDS